jgi:Ca2+/Na+ antiporter
MKAREKEAPPMPTQAKLYIACTAAAGLSLLLLGLFRGEFPDLPRFVSYFLLALLASTLKIRLPGMTGTMSVSFLFILIGIADYSFSQTIVMGCAATLIQSVWKAQRRPRLVQVIFNVAALAIATSIGYWGSHFALAATRADSLIVLLALATCLFFLTNTALVAIVLSLVEEKSFKKLWLQCYAWSFPYYLVGATIAGLVVSAGRSAGWEASLLVLPVMYLVYLYYRLYLENVARKQMRITAEGGHSHDGRKLEELSAIHATQPTNG